MKIVTVSNRANFDVCLGVVKNGGIDRNIIMYAKTKVVLDAGETINRKDIAELDGLVVCSEKIVAEVETVKKQLPSKNNVEVEDTKNA